MRIYHCSNRRLLIAVPVCTMLIGLMVGGSVLWRVGATWNTDALGHPTYYARGAELIQLLDAAEKAGKAKDSYASKVQGALSGFASLLANPDAGSVTGDRRALLVSDLHDNTLALSWLSYYAQGQPVFFDGDFGNTGDSRETRTLAPAIARLGSRVIAVSGDHDSHAMMLALARHGVTVLTSHGQLLANGTYGQPEIVVDGLRVAGFDDPMEVSGVAQAQRVVLSPDCAVSHTDCSSAVDYLDPREGPKTNAIRGARPICPLAPIAGARVP